MQSESEAYYVGVDLEKLLSLLTQVLWGLESFDMGGWRDVLASGGGGEAITKIWE